MYFSLATILSFAAAASAASLMHRQNTPTGQCCIANTSLKQDACTTENGETGRCVPGGNNCGGTLSCIANADLTCDNNVQERGNTLCRANAPGGGLFDGANIINSLDDATVN
ncbi:hypothetical protein F4778DRAFT_659499 [Xylariomycetidae sp. FL2044]|nr:hypothetical protein F4778DRAFT_659499 [Xylariomycetidae sp. FL2044]